MVPGALKHAFLGQLLHDWIAPLGSVRRFGCQYRGMDYANREILCRGVVTGKREQGGLCLVELELWTEDPSGRKATPGTATVVLPSRG